MPITSTAERLPLSPLQIGSLKLEVGSVDQALALVGSDRRDSAACLGFLNPHVYNLAGQQGGVAAFLERCEAVCLDGVGVALAGSLLAGRRLPRAVMHQVFDACIAQGLLRGRIVLLGLSAPEIERAAGRLRAAAPRAEIVACRHGFLADQDYDELFRTHHDADMVIVGMGTPRSEQVLLRARAICGHALCWHVGGGSLRHWAGTKRRAPLLLSRLGLEWLHRIAYEPQTRSRYTVGFPAFARRLLLDVLHRRRAGRPP